MASYQRGSKQIEHANLHLEIEGRMSHIEGKLEQHSELLTCITKELKEVAREARGVRMALWLLALIALPQNINSLPHVTTLIKHLIGL